MFFKREGNKSKYSNEIIKYFPKHTTYIEGFVGVGGIFFNKPLAKYNILNDSSQFIYSMYEILKDDDKLNKLIKEIEFTPNYFDYINKKCEDPLKTILKNSYSLYGAGQTQRCTNRCDKSLLISKLLENKDKFLFYTKYAIITNKDIFNFLKSISFKSHNEIDNSFIYLDPPYCVSKGALKDNKGWSFEKLEELINLLLKTKIKFAISEFNDFEVLELFKKYNLYVVTISKSKFNKTIDKYEILATNYEISRFKQDSLFK